MDAEWAYDHFPEHPCPLCGHDAFEFEVNRFDDGRVVKCKDCHHHYLNPAPTQEMLDQLLGVFHSSSNSGELLQALRHWHDQPDSVYQFAYRYLEVHGGFLGKKIVEVGCGPGLVLSECKRRGAEVLGIDPAPASKEHAKNFFGIDVVPASLEKIMSEKLIRPQSFDILLAFELIEHLHRPPLLMEAAQYLLKPGGKLVLSTPNFGLFEKMGSHAPAINAVVDHIQYFDVRSLKALVERCNLQLEHISSVQPLSVSSRKKAVLSRTPITNKIWRMARRLPLVKRAKERLFKTIDKVEAVVQPQAEDPMNGLAIVCCASIPRSV